MLAGGQSLVPLMSMRLAAPAPPRRRQPASPSWTPSTVDRGRGPGRRAGPPRRGSSRTPAAYDAVRRCCGQATGQRRAPDHPQPGYDGRQPGPRRPGRRDAGRARRCSAGRSSWRSTAGSRDGRRPRTSSSGRWSRRCAPASWPSRRPSPRRRRAAGPRSWSWPAGTATTRCAGSAALVTTDHDGAVTTARVGADQRRAGPGRRRRRRRRAGTGTAFDTERLAAAARRRHRPRGRHPRHRRLPPPPGRRADRTGPDRGARARRPPRRDERAS